MKPVQNMSQSLPFGICLAVIGGFLDAYTYFIRGGVFANAQTGNMVLMGISAAKGEFIKSGYYLLPVVAFFLGVLATEYLKKRFTRPQFTLWEHYVLAVECALLLLIGFIPEGAWDAPVNITVSFVASMQVHAFRNVGDMPYATTMCTGNLRSAAEHFFAAVSKKDKEAKRKCIGYFLIIFWFCAGAALGAVVCTLWRQKAVWVCCALLLAAEGMLLWETRGRGEGGGQAA